MADFDPRLTPARPDLAAKHLEGQVEAARFVEGTECQVIDAIAPMRRAPSHDAALDTEALKGERVTIPPPPTIADGIRLTTPGLLTFPILQRNVTDIVLVTDDEIRGAVRSLTLALKVIVEPTGAVAAAAALAGRLPLPAGARVGVILSGGNIDPALLIEILSGRETPG